MRAASDYQAFGQVDHQKPSLAKRVPGRGLAAWVVTQALSIATVRAAANRTTGTLEAAVGMMTKAR